MLKDLLTGMLDKNPDKRPTALELLEHPWFTPQTMEEENGGPAEELQIPDAGEIKVADEEAGTTV